MRPPVLVVTAVSVHTAMEREGGEVEREGGEVEREGGRRDVCMTFSEEYLHGGVCVHREVYKHAHAHTYARIQ